jgi:hypothetical protein
MKFKAKQFCSGYMTFSFEAKNKEEAQQILDQMNKGEDVTIELKQEEFEADDGGELRLIQ